MHTLGFGTATVQNLDRLPHGIQITWSDGRQRRFRFEWLYRNRPEILLPCGQNSASPLASPPSSPGAFAVSICSHGQRVKVQWGPQSESTFDSSWLLRFAQTDVVGGLESAPSKPVPLRSRTDAIPAVPYADLSSELGVLGLLEILNRDGVCIVGGVPVREGAVLELAWRIGPVMRTIYGEVRAEAPPGGCARTKAAQPPWARPATQRKHNRAPILHVEQTRRQHNRAPILHFAKT